MKRGEDATDINLQQVILHQADESMTDRIRIGNQGHLVCSSREMRGIAAPEEKCDSLMRRYATVSRIPTPQLMCVHNLKL
jgi:hypothetical protein